MSTVGDLVNEVRSMLQGSLPDELSVLRDNYVPGSGQITLAYPKARYQAGGVVCVGLNTFYVLKISNDGATYTVLPSFDGGPDLAYNAGEVVRLKPRHTTWAIMREWNGQLVQLSSPRNGLYGYGGFTSPINFHANTYALPSTAGWATQTPVRLLVARYQKPGTGNWQRIQAEWQPEFGVIRIFGQPPQGVQIEFVFAFPFLTATSLSTDVSTLGLTEDNQDLPGLGACQLLSLTGEARRNQLTSQGDTRRPEEVPAGATLGISREFGRLLEDRITEEQARLITLFGYWQPPTEWAGEVG